MKNIHVLKTDKPSRLFLKENTLLLNNQYTLQEIFSKGKCQNIYITSNEEIKEGDWYFWKMTKTVQKAKKDKLGRLPKFNDGSQKIILTTDQDLIDDGVQAIDDEFLEWFVKNPSCEEVEVVKEVNKSLSVKEPYYIYKIIIPKEEVLLQSSIDGEVIWGELKQETLEEAVKKYLENNKYFSPLNCAKIGAKWQQKRMYSEEEVIAFSQWMYDYKGDINKVKELLKQFKKK